MRILSLSLLCCLCALFALLTSVSCHEPEITTLKTGEEFMDARHIPVNYTREDVKAFLKLVKEMRLPPGFEATTIEHFKNGELEELRNQLQCCVCLGCLNAESMTTMRCGHVTHSKCYNDYRESQCPMCRSTARLAPEQDTAVTKLLRFLEKIESIPPADPEKIRRVVEKYTEAELREIRRAQEAERRQELDERCVTECEQLLLRKTFMRTHLLAHLRLLHHAVKTVSADLRVQLADPLNRPRHFSSLRPRNRNPFLSSSRYRESIVDKLWAKAMQIVPDMDEYVPPDCIPKLHLRRPDVGRSLDWLDRYADEMYRSNRNAMKQAFERVDGHDYYYYRDGIIPMSELFEIFRGLVDFDRQPYSDLKRHGALFMQVRYPYENAGAELFNRMYPNDGTSELESLEIHTDVQLPPRPQSRFYENWFTHDTYTYDG